MTRCPPRCLSNIALYGEGLLELTLMSLTEEYKCSKSETSDDIEGLQRTDQTINKVAPPTPTLTGRKWIPFNVVQQATSDLRHQNIVGNTQHGIEDFWPGSKQTNVA